KDFFAPLGAFLISLGVFFLPPFIVAGIFFTSSGSLPLAYLCAVGAVRILQRALDRGELAKHPRREASLLLVLLLTLLALFNYQSAAQVLICLPVLYICHFRQKDDLKRTLSCYLVTLALFIISASLYYAVWQWYKAAFLPDIDLGQRTIISSPI